MQSLKLSESELLAIIIGNGPKEFPTVDLMNYMMPQLEDLDVEEFLALFLNPKHEMLRRVRICRGETLRDHIILAEERYFSFKENKKL